MSRWIVEGLSTGKRTTRYPDQPERAPGVSPGFPQSGGDGDADAVARCPTGALESRAGSLAVIDERCVHCFRCQRGGPPAVDWSSEPRWSCRSDDGRAPLAPAFARSLSIRVVDAGACGACLHEVALLGKPHYNMHRLGFFVTPTPRKADVLLVAGPLTDHMRAPLAAAYDAMPDPKRVIAVGACALGGGVFGPSFACGSGVAEVVPVDVVVPGCPPPPLAILHALLRVAGREPPAGQGSKP